MSYNYNLKGVCGTFKVQHNILKAQFLKEKKWINKTIKIRNTCSAKDTVKGMKRQTTELEKYLQFTILIKDLYPEYFLKKLKTQQQENKQPNYH